MRENELESEADLNIKVETEKQENEPDIVDIAYLRYLYWKG